MTALDRRLHQLTEALSPTEAVGRCLAAAHTYGSPAAFAASLAGEPSTNPLTLLPRQVAAWVRHTTPGLGDLARTERTDRAVRAALVRWRTRQARLSFGSHAGGPSSEIATFAPGAVAGGEHDLWVGRRTSRL